MRSFFRRLLGIPKKEYVLGDKVMDFVYTKAVGSKPRPWSPGFEKHVWVRFRLLVREELGPMPHEDYEELTREFGRLHHEYTSAVLKAEVEFTLAVLRLWGRVKKEHM